MLHACISGTFAINGFTYTLSSERAFILRNDMDLWLPAELAVFRELVFVFKLLQDMYMELVVFKAV